MALTAPAQSGALTFAARTVTKMDTPDGPAVPKRTGASAFALLAKKSRRKFRQIITASGLVTGEAGDAGRRLQYPGNNGSMPLPRSNDAFAMVTARR